MKKQLIITHKNSYYYVRFANGELLGYFAFEWDAIARAEAYKRNSKHECSIVVNLTGK